MCVYVKESSSMHSTYIIMKILTFILCVLNTNKSKKYRVHNNGHRFIGFLSLIIQKAPLQKVLFGLALIKIKPVSYCNNLWIFPSYRFRKH